MDVRATIALVAAAVALAVAVASASAQDIGICPAMQSAAKGITNEGVTGAQVKEFKVQGGGVSCQYGRSSGGSDIERIPHVSPASFKTKQQAMKGTTVSGVGAPAFAMRGSNGYTALYVLTGTIEIVIYSKASLSAEKAAAKAVLPLVH